MSSSTDLLIRARNMIADAIDEAGGCDHKVGICACADAALMGEIDRYLIRFCAPDGIGQLVAICAAAAGREREMRAKWGNRMAAAIAAYARDIATEATDWDE